MGRPSPCPGPDELAKLAVEHTDAEIAKKFAVTRQTVTRWREEAGIPRVKRKGADVASEQVLVRLRRDELAEIKAALEPGETQAAGLRRLALEAARGRNAAPKRGKKEAKP